MEGKNNANFFYRHRMYNVNRIKIFLNMQIVTVKQTQTQYTMNMIAVKQQH